MSENLKSDKWLKDPCDEFDEKSILDGEDSKLIKPLRHDGPVVTDAAFIGIQVEGFYPDNSKCMESAAPNARLAGDLQILGCLLPNDLDRLVWTDSRACVCALQSFSMLWELSEIATCEGSSARWNLELVALRCLARSLEHILKQFTLFMYKTKDQLASFPVKQAGPKRDGEMYTCAKAYELRLRIHQQVITLGEVDGGMWDSGKISGCGIIPPRSLEELYWIASLQLGCHGLENMNKGFSKKSEYEQKVNSMLPLRKMRLAQCAQYPAKSDITEVENSGSKSYWLARQKPFPFDS
ncbi:hypothetical protein IFM89_033022 [Coptis chinensis]|uniref:Uncharacterized protein n=1 Tax=Coptis chinensis TaxID=261450 RepID=A0A835IIB0_9MAGN|nr:hypothetical protein IFM89_033022 [Coptis chinensis]